MTALELTDSAQPTSSTAARLGPRLAERGIAWLSTSSVSAVCVRGSAGTVVSVVVGGFVDLNRNAFALA